MLVVRTEIAINQLKELDAVLTLRAKAAIVGRYQEDLQQYPSIEVLWKDIPETYKVYTGPDKVKLVSNLSAINALWGSSNPSFCQESLCLKRLR